ncbi:hypothetical protein PybrP1_000749 [[Pythium] brassicae (nom. inval.)]|nr:hypothetical protein PybrP1_000749 [[Pythium] brassicae (nom. inval.)]
MEFSVTLDLPDKKGYRFHPTVHISRLKLRRDFPSRPSVEISDSAVGERFDFDEAQLPENSWVMEGLNEYAIEAIEDERSERQARHGRVRCQFLAKWVGYEERYWLDETELTCGALIYDFELQRRRENRLGGMQVLDENTTSA